MKKVRGITKAVGASQLEALTKEGWEIVDVVRQPTKVRLDGETAEPKINAFSVVRSFQEAIQYEPLFLVNLEGERAHALLAQELAEAKVRAACILEKETQLKHLEATVKDLEMKNTQQKQEYLNQIEHLKQQLQTHSLTSEEASRRGRRFLRAWERVWSEVGGQRMREILGDQLLQGLEVHSETIVKDAFERMMEAD